MLHIETKYQVLAFFMLMLSFPLRGADISLSTESVFKAVQTGQGDITHSVEVGVDESLSDAMSVGFAQSLTYQPDLEDQQRRLLPDDFSLFGAYGYAITDELGLNPRLTLVLPTSEASVLAELQSSLLAAAPLTMRWPYRFYYRITPSAQYDFYRYTLDREGRPHRLIAFRLAHEVGTGFAGFTASVQGSLRQDRFALGKRVDRYGVMGKMAYAFDDSVSLYTGVSVGDRQYFGQKTRFERVADKRIRTYVTGLSVSF